MIDATQQHRRRIFLGCIADDVTGASDLASNLVLGGMRTVMVFGVPEPRDFEAVEADAIVVALKSRSMNAEVAVEQSKQCLALLRRAGACRFYFKYCSTFDSTPSGNIGPVAEALMDELRVEQTIFCPSFPRNRRTVYQGHLFADGKLLNESGMENHPLNPMTDSNLLRVLGEQTKRRVGLVDLDSVEDRRVQASIQSLVACDQPLAIVDACNDRHLQSIAEEVSGMPLVTGGSGLARFLPAAWRNKGDLSTPPSDAMPNPVKGRTVILSGSCSSTTNRQVDYMETRCPTIRLDVDKIVQSTKGELAKVVSWAASQPPTQPILISSTNAPHQVSELQDRYGSTTVALAIEAFFASLAKRLVDELGVRRLILAGGETSGAAIERLGVKAIRVGHEICPGVPFTESTGKPSLGLVLKSGNFGSDTFFEDALETNE